ncbi:MAG TPA: LysR family transcriptional regulator [Geminicoccaceae bacterium]|nr:LysR family transcriptional regulator [Geminicoccaceae bacterium]
MITLHQLKMFWAVAHGPTLTRAAKQLGVTQPSLSQQLARLEEAVGGRLFERTGNELRLTDAGAFLLRKAEIILAEVDEAEGGLAEFTSGRRGRLSVGALSSIARSVLPDAWARALETFPELELDIHELAPREAVEQLYGRNLQMALLSPDSVAGNRHSFHMQPVCSDPYVLAVPPGLRLDGIRDPDRELPPAARATVNRCIQFNFGNLHTQRVEDWYRQSLPRHEVVAQCRTYDVALAMVEAGLGVALVPLLAAAHGPRLLFRVDLYGTTMARRRIVALVPPQYLRLQPCLGFLEALGAAGRALELPEAAPAPPFLRRDAAQAAE